jgi:hypothetical protein
MAQHDYVIANGTGAAVRSDLNNGLAAIVSQNSGATEPAVMYAYQWWADTTTGLLKIRNAANNAWVTIGTLANANLGLATLASPTFTGTVTIPAGASISGFAPLASPTFTGTVTIPAGASISGFAPLASPTLTGTPSAPTAAAGTNTTQLATTAFVLANTVPAGAIDYFAMSTAPTGYLKANGAAISRTTYATLFSAIGTTYGAGDGSTTFTLPDLRGEFIRSWADGRAVDTGRTFASFQDQAYLSHNHGVNDPGHNHGISDPGHAHRWGTDDNGGAGGGGNPDANGGTDWKAFTEGAGTGISINGSGTGVSIQSNGGSETRPRNIALLACIKF